MIRSNEVVNQVTESYLNDCFKYGETICVGEWSNRELKYSKIIEVYDLLGRLKHTYEGGKQ